MSDRSEQHRFVLGWGKRKEGGREGRGRKQKSIEWLRWVFRISRAISLLSLSNPQTLPLLYSVFFSWDSERPLPEKSRLRRVAIIMVVTSIQNDAACQCRHKKMPQWQHTLSSRHLSSLFFFYCWWHWMALGNHLFITPQLSWQLRCEAAAAPPESHWSSTRR